ncbi:hypothetical protein ACPXAO_25070, partial [Salmonella enterica]|uniref:hypothetical protein n=1 Tax=Salmonella enterica TaxID=28901 RepID=UPI003CFBB136
LRPSWSFPATDTAMAAATGVDTGVNTAMAMATGMATGAVDLSGAALNRLLPPLGAAFSVVPAPGPGRGWPA